MQLNLSKKIIFYFFLIIFLSTFNNKYIKKIELKSVDNVTIIGLDESEKQDLMNDLKLLRSKNIFFLDKSEIVNKLDENKIIENYTIFKKYPSSLEIRVNKTKFLANVFSDGNFFLLGSNGKLIKSKKKNNNLPNIFGDYDKESFFNLLKSMNKSNFKLSEIKNLYYFKSGRWDLETNLGIMIKLPKNDLENFLNLSLSIIDDDKFEKIKILDLRQNNQVIING